MQDEFALKEVGPPEATEQNQAPFSQPACSLGFFQHQLAGNHFAPETVHRKMEGGIIVFNGVDEVAYRDLGIQLFPDLSFQCLLCGFSRSILPPGNSHWPL